MQLDALAQVLARVHAQASTCTLVEYATAHHVSARHVNARERMTRTRNSQTDTYRVDAVDRNRYMVVTAIIILPRSLLDLR